MPTIKITSVRLSFPALFVPREAMEAGKPAKYEATFIFAPGSEADKAVHNAILLAANEKWGPKAVGTLDKITADGRVCFHKTPKMNDSGEIYDGFDGMHWLKATNEARPAVIDKNTQPLTQQDGRPYSGCFVDASLEIWAQDNSWGKRINAKLRWVQFRADGDAFSGGAPVSQDEFEAIAEGAAAGDLV
jgi:hypothetical protein